MTIPSTTPATHCLAVMLLRRGRTITAKSTAAQKSRNAVVAAGPISAITGIESAAPSWTLNIDPRAKNSGGSAGLFTLQTGW